jgi:hypothetical protein
MGIYIPSLSQISFSEESTFGTAAVPGAQTLGFGIINEEASLPDPAVEQTVLHSVGNGANPHLIIPAARTLSGSLSFYLQNGRPLKYLLGGYSVSGSGTYTHAITCADAAPSSMCVEATYDDGTTDFTRYFRGTVMTGASITAEEEGFVKMAADVESAKITTSTTETTSTLAADETEPYVFCEGACTYFGTSYARVLDFDIGVKRAFKARRYIQTTDACYPSEINFGTREIELSTTVVASQDTAVYGTEIYEELLSQTSGGSNMVMLFTRGASDTIEFTLTGCMLKEAPHPINPAAEDYPVALSLVAKGISVECVDTTATY